MITFAVAMRRLRENPLKGLLPEEMRLLRSMFRERLRERLPEASRKRLREAAREGLREAPIIFLLKISLQAEHCLRWPCGAASGIRLFQRPSNQLS
jgi:hypothetical protein